MHNLTVKSTGVAVITPFDANGSVNHDALARIIHFLIDSGIDSVSYTHLTLPTRLSV